MSGTTSSSLQFARSTSLESQTPVQGRNHLKSQFFFGLMTASTLCALPPSTGRVVLCYICITYSIQNTFSCNIQYMSTYVYIFYILT